MDEIWYSGISGAASYESELTIQKFRMAQQCRQYVVTGRSNTAVDVPFTWRYVYYIFACSAFGSEATSYIQNSAECGRRIELSYDTTYR